MQKLWLALAAIAVLIAGIAVTSMRYDPVRFALGNDESAPCIGPARASVLQQQAEQYEVRLPDLPDSSGFCIVLDRWTGTARAIPME